ncbi:hypothetical protein NQ314_017648 [Rhamnusium bicolor]|uniref:Uncharacterized protein n=1 Tax=Rhamnusium bicolor TaxID=1586634 RepID=A0AAV8WUB1_9CUCU|nr:hypothetical protein NQ314_017648 [Rhamnusium bicolor]
MAPPIVLTSQKTPCVMSTTDNTRTPAFWPTTVLNGHTEVLV